MVSGWFLMEARYQFSQSIYFHAIKHYLALVLIILLKKKAKFKLHTLTKKINHFKFENGYSLIL